MPSQPQIAVRDLTFSYDSAQGPLVARISIHFPTGFTGIVGANGAGKTTLLQLITGELLPSAGYETGIWLPGSRSQRHVLFTLHPGEISLGDDRVLKFPQVMMKPGDRIAIIGSNGSGKSTLIRHILKALNVPDEQVVDMPQEVSATTATKIMEEVRLLQHSQLGHIMNVVSRLGSRPNRLLESHRPSPGEIRKLLLAIGMSKSPHIIVMDEPTNHLDLPSIEALEKALSDCPGGLLLVSHDHRFLEGLATQWWCIEVDEQGNSELIID